MNIENSQFIILVVSLGAAFFIGLNHVLIRRALDEGSRTQAVLFSLGTSTILFWVLLPIFGQLNYLLDPKAGLFVVAGLLGPGIGRTLNIMSLKRVGVARTAPIIGIAPLFAAVLAILFLGEEFLIVTLVSIFLIFLGIYMLEHKKENRFWQLGTGDKKNLFTPLTAAFFGGSYLVFIKWILSEIPDVFVGAALSTTGALFALFAFGFVSGHLRKIKSSRRAFEFSVLGGLSMAFGFLLNFYALNLGSVSLVAPVLSTFPLFSVLLSLIFLKEGITSQILIGALIIVGGIVILNIQ
jgi:drug/metabolite transporter (DMT)-like permease